MWDAVREVRTSIASSRGIWRDRPRRTAMSQPPFDTLLSNAAKELCAREERLHQRIMLFHVAREWLGDVYVRRLQRDAGGEAVLEVIRDVGLGALRPEASETEEERDSELQELREVVWQRIEEWYRMARGGD